MRTEKQQQKAPSIGRQSYSVLRGSAHEYRRLGAVGLLLIVFEFPPFSESYQQLHF